MGAVTFALEGKTKGEVKRKISQKLAESKLEGLYEDRRSDIIYKPREQLYFAVLRVHT